MYIKLTLKMKDLLGAKYGKVEIEEVIKDNCSYLHPLKRRQLRDALLKHGTLFN